MAGPFYISQFPVASTTVEHEAIYGNTKSPYRGSNHCHSCPVLSTPSAESVHALKSSSATSWKILGVDLDFAFKTYALPLGYSLY